MKFVATKTADQLDLQALHRVRERLAVYWLTAEPSRRASLGCATVKPRSYHRLPTEVCERIKTDGGSVFPACANTGDPNGPIRPFRQ